MSMHVGPVVAVTDLARARAFYEGDLGLTGDTLTLDTVLTPGLVFTNSSAGRMVCAVVLTAPETIPSARPSSTIMVPK